MKFVAGDLVKPNAESILGKMILLIHGRGPYIVREVARGSWQPILTIATISMGGHPTGKFPAECLVKVGHIGGHMFRLEAWQAIAQRFNAHHLPYFVFIASPGTKETYRGFLVGLEIGKSRAHLTLCELSVQSPHTNRSWKKIAPYAGMRLDIRKNATPRSTRNNSALILRIGETRAISVLPRSATLH